MIIYDKEKKTLFIPEKDDAVILEWDDIYNKGYQDGYKEGYDEEFQDAYDEGYDDGYASGLTACYVVASAITLDVLSPVIGEGWATTTVYPADADVDLVYSSSSSAATIDQLGEITVVGDGEVTFCVTDTRSGLSDCKTVDVEGYYLRVIPTSVSNIPASGNSYTFFVESNHRWTVNNTNDWITATSGGTGYGSINVTVSANSSLSSRTGTITVVSEEIYSPVFITLSQKETEWQPTFNFYYEPEGTPITGANERLFIDMDVDQYTVSVLVESNSNLPWVAVSQLGTQLYASGTSSAIVEEVFRIPDDAEDNKQLVFFYKMPGDVEDGPHPWDTWSGQGPRISLFPNLPTGGTFYPGDVVDEEGDFAPVFSPDWTNTFARFWEGEIVNDSPSIATVTPNTGSGAGTWHIVPLQNGTITLSVSVPYPPNTYATFTKEMTVIVSPDTGDTPSRQVTVQQLIAEGYADVVPPGGEYKAGTYVEILPSCPYLPSEIVNLRDVALNDEQLTAGTQNTIVWDKTLPSGWTEADIIDLYSGTTLPFTPRGGQFWDIKSGTTSFTVSYTGDTYVTSDTPWGSYSSEGVFSPRWNQNKEGTYYANGWRQTPETVVVNIASTFSSVSQVMFSQMKTTRYLTINQQAGTFACHDVVGMFEGDSALEILTINGAFNFGTWRTQHNVFDGCSALTGIPYSTSWTREHTNNTIFPHADGVRGSANCYHMFRGCTSLTYLGPTFNMAAMSLSGCTYNGVNQAKLTSTLFECPVLADVRIKGLNNNDWCFADDSTYTSIPNMNVASIEYLLNNVEDVVSQGGHTVTFHSRYMNDVSQTAIDNANAKGWNVSWLTPGVS